MKANKNLNKKIDELQSLLAKLNQAKTYLDKLDILDSLPIVINYLKNSNPINIFLKNLTPESEFAVKSIIAIGQGPIVFKMDSNIKDHFNRLIQLLEQLFEIQIFYQHMGGIIGYHLTVMTLIVRQQTKFKTDLKTRYIHPDGLYLGADQPGVQQAVRWGIENINQLAFIFPLGGAGDRLNLTDDATGIPLPAARLPFLGRTLLEGLIRDLQAKEYLYFKLFRKQLLTPIAIMTSVEKNNHIHILEICEEGSWFGRSPESFYFFIQPVVPVITIEGNWSLAATLTLSLKPSGHGVMWKLAEDQGVFAWLKSKGRHRCLIRQINNPLAGTDNCLLALFGIGSKKKKSFGFASCERLINSDEGTNVLIEKEKKGSFDYCLTNIEYTDFAQKGIEEIPAKPGSQFSIFPTNTNILYADITKVRKILKSCPIPGQLINMKSNVSYIDDKGEQSFIPGGRLESTMQNIADYIVDNFPRKLNDKERRDALSSFIVYNDRAKTISTTKKSYKKGESPIATPEQAYFDLMANHYQLLLKCDFKLPEWNEIEDYLHFGPSCIFLFHPALGPLHSIIIQKIRKGRFAKGAELQLEIGEIDIEDLTLKGSLIIESKPPIGVYDDSGILQYKNEARCTLKQVSISNRGIDRSSKTAYWKNDLPRLEEVRIILHEGSEFQAEGIVLKGSRYFEIPSYHRLVLKSLPNGSLVEELTPIKKPSWQWNYAFDSEDRIVLKKFRAEMRFR